MNARRVVCPVPGKVEIESFEVGAPGPGWLLVETEVTAVSPGTERAWFTKAPDTPVKFPYHPGYCHVGRVIAVGEGVNNFAEADRVLTQASHRSVALVRATQAYKVPDGVAAQDAALTPLVEIALQGVRKARIELGSSVCVIGAGVIGLLALKTAKLFGAHPLISSDLSAHRREIALRAGADRVVAPDELTKLSGQLDGRATPDPGFNAVIDATGHPAALGTAIEICGTQGVVLLLGSTRGRADGVNVYEVHRKGLHLVGAHGRNCPPDQSYPTMWTVRDDIELVLRLLRDGRLHVADLITDVVEPDAVPGLFERLKGSDETLLGCVIDWG